MSDLKRLDEALAYFRPVEPDYTQDVYPTWWHLLDAARAYRDLLANGPVPATKCVFPLVKECLLVYPTDERVGYYHNNGVEPGEER